MIYLLSKLIVLGARRLSSLWSEPLITPLKGLKFVKGFHSTMSIDENFVVQ